MEEQSPSLKIEKFRKRLDVPINPVPGINGLTTEDRLRLGSETLLFKPEKPNPFQAVVVVPGFGHTVGNIGDSFHEFAKGAVEGLGVTTAVTVPDTRDSEKMTMWSFLPGEIFAYEDALGLVKLPVHTIAFSRSCSEILESSAEISDKRQILSVTLIAPSLRTRTVDIFETAGIPVERFTDKHGPGIALGRRGTIVMEALANQPTWQVEGEIRALKESATKLKKLAIPVRIFACKSDPIVGPKFVEEFAQPADLQVIWVDSGSTPKGLIHDFNSDSMRKPIYQYIQSIIIAETRVFTVQKEN